MEVIINTRREADEQERDWSGLPGLVLNLIHSKILKSIRDLDSLCCFRAVCKSWGSVSLPNLKLRVPRLLHAGSDMSLIKMFNPVSNFTYTAGVPEMAGAKLILSSENGWLLICRVKDEDQNQNDMFLFNPYTKRKMDLPSTQGVWLNRVGWSSSDPTSPDCQFLGTYSAFGYNCFFYFAREIYFWPQEDYRWVHMTIPIPDAQATANPIFHNGLFYVLGEHKLLMAFDPRDFDGRGGKCWKIG
ncbi:hypothetical protein Tsubulata_017689 [Turnera subulata]|uniref:KIB1-4 beta-propeller domain-containing protein n=1 Tax=Turnera subulata TaxID=218843 RepID=A0A9Q0G5T5_9ROSI|nr:hypothetical protein Tsubulata_017689 [Turnera subulata]